MGDKPRQTIMTQESLDISFVKAGGGTGIADRITHEKTLPWAVFAQSVKGWYEISVNGGPFRKTEPNGAFLVPANRRMRIIHRHPGNAMEINWIHIQGVLHGSLDLLSFFRLPLILSPSKAIPIGKLVRRVRTLRQDMAGLLQLKALAFDIMRGICECGARVEARETVAIERMLPIVRAIEEKPGRRLSVADMAELINVSAPRLHALFRESFGQTPHGYLLEARIKAAKMKLLATDETIQEIAAATGFDDPFHFSRAFKKLVGLSPSLYREQRTVPGA